jgi:hypothetical protein
MKNVKSTLVSKMTIEIIWAAISALRSRFFAPLLFPGLQKELHSGRAAVTKTTQIKN